MTGNQIAYAELQESSRHNKTNEEEVARHNVATENLQAEANRIAEARLNAENIWNTEKNRIQEEYNSWYSEYQTASTGRKLEIEKYLAHLKQQEITNDNNYKMSLVGLKDEENALVEARNAETKRHNEATETVSAYEAILKDRHTEYENTFWRETVGVNMLNAEANMLRSEASADLDYFRLFSENELLPYRKAESYTHTMVQRADATPFIKPLPLDYSPLAVSGYLKLFQ